MELSFLKLYTFISLALLLSACTDKAVEQDFKVFKYNQPNSITSLDPAFAKSQNNIWAVNHLFNGLVDLDSNLNIVPSIAKNWIISDSGRTYTFLLRQDVFFHDDQCFENGEGRRVKAADVAYSLGRLIDTEVGSPGSWLFSDKVSSDAFIALDDTTFVLKLKRPFLPMLGILAMQYCSIVPKEGIEHYKKDWRSQPVGTGPFRFKRWQENQALFLERNNNYFDQNKTSEKSKIEIVKTSFILDKQVALYELINGNLDLISGLQSSFINDVLDKQGNLLTKYEDKLRLFKSPYLNVEYLGINLKLAQRSNSPLAKREVRQALNYAIDKDAMLKGLRNGVGSPANNGFIPKGLPSFNENKNKGYQYDPDRARELLQSSGYFETAEEIVLNTNSEYLDLCTYVVKQWQDIGLNCKLEVMESATLREGMRKSQVPMFRASWIADYPDAESFLCMYYSKNPPPPNYTRYQNLDYDVLYEAAVAEPNLNVRMELYQKMDSILIEDAPVIFLFYDESAVITSSRLRGFTGNGINLLNVEGLDKTK